MKAKLFLAGFAMSALSSVAMAQTVNKVDGVINFQGAILNDTCKVSSATGDAGTINVSMGNIAADDIGTVAAPKRLTNGAGSANFDVVCKKGAKVSMKFAGKVAELSADKKTLRVNNGRKSHKQRAKTTCCNSLCASASRCSIGPLVWAVILSKRPPVCNGN